MLQPKLGFRSLPAPPVIPCIDHFPIYTQVLGQNFDPWNPWLSNLKCQTLNPAASLRTQTHARALPKKGADSERAGRLCPLRVDLAIAHGQGSALTYEMVMGQFYVLRGVLIRLAIASCMSLRRAVRHGLIAAVGI